MSVPEKQKLTLVTSKKEVGKVVEFPIPKPSKNQVLVKVAFSPINPSDVGILEGWYPTAAKLPYGVGFEASGTIVAVGQNLRVPHQVGDKVHVMGQGGWGQYMLATSEACYKVQEGTSMEQAACHFVNPVTVIYMAKMVEQGGHKAAIHTAGMSTLGRIIIRYFKEKGIKLINIVRRQEYVQKLLDDGADYVLNSEDKDFSSQLRTLAAKEKATICFDAIAGKFSGKVLGLMPDSSVMCVYGVLSGDQPTGFTMSDLSFQGKSVTGLHASRYYREVLAKGKANELYGEIQKNLNTNFKANIQRVFTLDELETALKFYKENQSKGKVLIKPNL